MRGRLSEEDATAVFGGLNLAPRELRRVNRIILTACGTSWHSSLVGEYTIEELARLPVEVEYASELRYRNPPVDHGTLLFAITQSGETADTLAALREMKRKGHPTLAICNVVGSTIAQEAERRYLPARRPGNRRGVHQGLHLAVSRSRIAGAVLRPPAPPELPGRSPDHRRTAGAARPGARSAQDERPRAADRRASTATSTTSCTSAGSSTSPRRSRAL